MALTAKQLGYAQMILQVGESMGITPLGIEIAFAVVYAESDWVNYANPADPESLDYPYDALGGTGESDGLFQQTSPWWGTAECRMTPACAAQQFFAALEQYPYNSGAQTPGYYAQLVQQSAPGANIYDAQMPAAIALYNQLTQGGPVTSPLWGVDISNNNFGGDVNYDLSLIGPFISALPGEGFSWVEAKCSQGGGPTAFIDPTYSTVYAACRANNLLCIPYHYADTSDAASQAQNCLAAIGGTPQPVMIDFEAVDNNGNPLLNIGDFWALVDALNDLDIPVALSYIPQWYWNEIGQPDLSQVPGLISSSFVGGSGYASVLYPGNDAASWNSYGGATPVIYQFTASAVVAGLSGVGADAFQGSISDLQKLLGQGGPAPMTTAQQVLADYNGVDPNGNPNWYDIVLGRADIIAFQYINDPLRGPWNEPPPNPNVTTVTGPNGEAVPITGVWDHGAQTVLAAEAVTPRYVDSTGTRVDIPTILIVLWEWLRATVPAEQFAALLQTAQTRRTAPYSWETPSTT